MSGQRKFRLASHSDDTPDLDDIRAEIPARVDAARVRFVKAFGTNITLGCN